MMVWHALTPIFVFISEALLLVCSQLERLLKLLHRVHYRLRSQHSFQLATESSVRILCATRRRYLLVSTPRDSFPCQKHRLVNFHRYLYLSRLFSPPLPRQFSIFHQKIKKTWRNSRLETRNGWCYLVTVRNRENKFSMFTSWKSIFATARWER